MRRQVEGIDRPLESNGGSLSKKTKVGFIAVEGDWRIGGSRERTLFVNAIAKKMVKSNSPMADILSLLVSPHEIEEV